MTEEYLLKRNNNVGFRNGIVDQDEEWPGGIVYYQFKSSSYSKQQEGAIRDAMKEIEEKTKIGNRDCVQFMPRTSEQDYLIIEAAQGCSSFVGRYGGEQPVSLAYTCLRKKGTIMHEFIHALGFHHEQKRTDRDKYITIEWNNIREEDKFNFEKLGADKINLLNTPYDYGSLLHYGSYSFAKNAKEPTIYPKDPNASIGQRIAMSAMDIKRIQLLYGCIKNSVNEETDYEEYEQEYEEVYE